MTNCHYFNLWISDLTPLDPIAPQWYSLTPMTKSQQKRLERDRCLMKFRLEPSVYRELKMLSEAEDRSMAYLARVFIKAGVDDRNRGGMRTNG